MPQKTPKVSVLMPAYNVEKYVGAAIESILNQTFSDFEFIIINDGSTDNTAKIIKEYAKKDKRIRFIDNKNNRGVSVSRNMGLDIAQGEYVGFIDADDYVDNDFYEKLYNTAITENADIAKAQLKVLYNGHCNIIDISDSIKANKYAFIRHFTTGIYRIQLLRKYKIYFPENLMLTEDTCFLIKAVHYANKVSLLNGSFYNYIRQDTLSDSKEYNYKNCCDAINGYVCLYKWLNSVMLPDAAYDLVLEYICRLALYPFEKTQLEIYKSKLGSGLCQIFSESHKDIYTRVWGQELTDAVYSDDVKEILNVINKKDKKIKKIKLFGLIPFMRYVYDDNTLVLKLFNVIPFLRIKKYTYKTELYILGLLIIKIK